MDTKEGIIDEAELRQELRDAFGLQNLTQEDSDAVLEKMMEALIKTIMLRTFERLGDAGVDEYEKLLERASEPGEIATFLESRIPGYNVFVKEIVSEFKHSMAEAVIEE